MFPRKFHQKRHTVNPLPLGSGGTTGHPEARKLLDYTIEIIEKYFWSEEEQMCLESWDEAFSKTEEYRGGNANMHAVEAFLIVYDVTTSPISPPACRMTA